MVLDGSRIVYFDFMHCHAVTSCCQIWMGVRAQTVIKPSTSSCHQLLWKHMVPDVRPIRIRKCTHAGSRLSSTTSDGTKCMYNTWHLLTFICCWQHRSFVCNLVCCNPNPDNNIGKVWTTCQMPMSSVCFYICQAMRHYVMAYIFCLYLFLILFHMQILLT